MPGAFSAPSSSARRCCCCSAGISTAGTRARSGLRAERPDPASVETQDRFLDLLTATGCEAAVDANALEPSFLQYSKRTDVVRGRSGVHGTFGSLCKKNLQCCARDAFPPLRSVHPVGHLKLIVDMEGADRSSDCSVDIDDSVRDACVGPQARRPVEKRAAIGLILGCERGHSNRLRIRHLLIDRVEIPVLN